LVEADQISDYEPWNDLLQDYAGDHDRGKIVTVRYSVGVVCGTGDERKASPVTRRASFRPLKLPAYYRGSVVNHRPALKGLATGHQRPYMQWGPVRMYWVVLSVVATIVLLMLAISAVCLARELRRSSWSDIKKAVLARHSPRTAHDGRPSR
jgi:hypothetical protein